MKDRPAGVPDLCNAKQMAEVFGMKVTTWRYIARRRHYPCYKIGRAVRWDVNEVLAIVRQEDERRQKSGSRATKRPQHPPETPRNPRKHE